MPAHLTTIADAVVDALNAATFTAPHAAVVAERKYRLGKNLEDMGDKVYATVVPVGTAADAVTRSAIKNRGIIVEIGVQRRVNFATNDDPDSMQLLVEEIENLFVGKDLSGTDASCTTSEIGPPYYLEHQDQMELFTALIRLTFLLPTT